MAFPFPAYSAWQALISNWNLTVVEFGGVNFPVGGTFACVVAFVFFYFPLWAGIRRLDQATESSVESYNEQISHRDRYIDHLHRSFEELRLQMMREARLDLSSQIASKLDKNNALYQRIDFNLLSGQINVRR